MPVTSWSTTPSNNNAAPPNGWPEGMAAAAVNDTARQQMADLVVEFQRNQVKTLGTVAGTNTITAAMTPATTGYSAGMFVSFTPANTNTGAATLNINSVGALDILKADGDALVAGDLVVGVPAFLLLDSGSDDWYLLNPQTFSVTALSATGALTGASLSITGAATINGPLTTDNTTADEPGFKGLPLTNQAGNYTLVLDDAGKCIRHGSGDGAGDTYTIPAEASVNFPIGTAVTFINLDTNAVSIAITTDTMYLAGTTTTGTRSLAQNGIATAVKAGGATWLISGTGLS